jgi:hypothetical protein
MFSDDLSLRKGEVSAYVGGIQTLKDLKDLPHFTCGFTILLGALPWSPFPPRRARPGPSPHSYSRIRTRTVLGSYGRIVLGSYGRIVLASYGRTVLGSYGRIVLGSYGRIVLRSYGRTVLASYGRAIPSGIRSP